jgi:hypothetical protein
MPQNLQSLVDAFRSRPTIGMMVGGVSYIDQNGASLYRTPIFPIEGDLSILLMGNTISPSGAMIRRSWLEQVGPFDEGLRACEDWDMWLRLAQAGCQIGWVGRYLTQYRFHQGQMTRDAQRMRTAMFAVLDKVFHRLDLPEDWKKKRNRAYAAAHIKAAMREYISLEIPNAQFDLNEAVALDPSLLENQGSRITEHILNWATAPYIEDPLAQLEIIYRNLPDSLSMVRRKRSRELGKFAVQMAFEHFNKNEFAKSKYFLIRAFRYEPKWVVNRGVISIFIRTHIASDG